MCGIAGMVDFIAGADRAVVLRQLDCLTHRGPDSSGAFVDGAGAVGQTRLAVIDLRTGDPPITDEHGDIGVALNGEIYNFADLREDLAASGHRLSTAGDTEVIAHLAERFEPERLAQCLDGMFAFAVWDRRRRRLVLGRDRLGEKPLYYWSDGAHRLAFGSEIKALLAHPVVPRRFDTEVLPAYLAFGYVPTPRTMFEGIRSLRPGHVLVFDEQGLRERPYWSPPLPSAAAPPLDVTLSEAAALVRQELDRSVRQRLVADVPLGAFLSGGIDSSAVVALMAGAGQRVKTFTIGFEDHDGFDERPHARAVASHLGTDHVEFVVKPEALDLVERLVWHHDQPFGDSSAVPTFLLSELTRGHVTVALSGDGGDELFAGYERFAAGLAAARLAGMPLPLRRAAASAASLLPPTAIKGGVGKVQRFLSRAELGLPAAYREWITYVPPEWRERLLPEASGWGLRDYDAIWGATEGAAPLDRLLLLNLQTYLLDDLLPKVDRMSMAHGLEVRAPFLDHRLVELAFRLPPATRLRGLSLKRALKEAVRDLLPPQILERGKHGFGVPLDRWFREDLSLYVRGMIGDEASRVRQHLQGQAVDAMLTEHEAGVASHGHALWTLLTLEVFLRQHGW